MIQNPPPQDVITIKWKIDSYKHKCDCTMVFITWVCSLIDHYSKWIRRIKFRKKFITQGLTLRILCSKNQNEMGEAEIKIGAKIRSMLFKDLIPMSIQVLYINIWPQRIHTFMRKTSSSTYDKFSEKKMKHIWRHIARTHTITSGEPKSCIDFQQSNQTSIMHIASLLEIKFSQISQPF